MANAGRNPENFIPPPLKAQSEKVNKVSLEWATLIYRVYEVNPMICSTCGGRIKIIGFVTHKAEIFRILGRTGWLLQCHEFDPAADFSEGNMSQLLPDTVDGFPEMGTEESTHWSKGDQSELTEEKGNYLSFKVKNEVNGDPEYWCVKEGGRDAPLHWEHPESYCDPPHEEVYVDRPHEWD